MDIQIEKEKKIFKIYQYILSIVGSLLGLSLALGILNFRQLAILFLFLVVLSVLFVTNFCPNVFNKEEKEKWMQ